MYSPSGLSQGRFYRKFFERYIRLIMETGKHFQLLISAAEQVIVLKQSRFIVLFGPDPLWQTLSGNAMTPIIRADQPSQ